MTELFVLGDAHLVAMDDVHIAALQQANPCYAKSVIAANTYMGQTAACTTVAVGATVVARSDVPKNAVYALTADIYDNAASRVTTHSKYGEINAAHGASLTGMPYHPGAARYFAQKGFAVSVFED